MVQILYFYQIEMKKKCAVFQPSRDATGKAWDTPYPFGPAGARTSLWVTVSRGDSTRDMPLLLVSNSKPTVCLPLIACVLSHPAFDQKAVQSTSCCLGRQWRLHPLVSTANPPVHHLLSSSSDLETVRVTAICAKFGLDMPLVSTPTVCLLVPIARFTLRMLLYDRPARHMLLPH